MKQIILSLLLLFVSLQIKAQEKKTITFSSSENVDVTADLYLTNDNNAPFIILFHQAMFSRGEYIEIAPKLNALGFNCMAVDQRSGHKVNNIVNETNNQAKKKKKDTKYPDAYPDLEASVKYISKNYSKNKIIVWGSSYSASLVFVLAAKDKNISGLLAFSPGEYFKFEDKMISEWAQEVNCPVFVSSSQKEGIECALIFNQATNMKNVQYIPEFSGFHGSKALWEENEGNKAYWEKVKSFLKNL